jgi:hypothetical protein
MSGTVGGMEAAGERAGGAAGSGSTSGSLSPAPAGGDEDGRGGRESLPR